MELHTTYRWNMNNKHGASHNISMECEQYAWSFTQHIDGMWKNDKSWLTMFFYDSKYYKTKD